MILKLLQKFPKTFFSNLNVILDPDIAEFSLASAKPIIIDGLQTNMNLSREDQSSLLTKGKMKPSIMSKNKEIVLKGESGSM